MNTVRLSRVRTILLTAAAAFCLVTFGAMPHSSSSAIGAPAHNAQAQAGAHHDAEIVARTEAGSGVAEIAAFPAADLGSAGLPLALAALLLALVLGRRRSAVRYRTGPAPARAPPLAA
jgi:hypothetical protein